MPNCIIPDIYCIHKSKFSLLSLITIRCCIRAHIVFYMNIKKLLHKIMINATILLGSLFKRMQLCYSGFVSCLVYK